MDEDDENEEDHKSMNLAGNIEDQTNVEEATATTLKVTWKWIDATRTAVDFDNVHVFFVEWIKTSADNGDTSWDVEGNDDSGYWYAVLHLDCMLMFGFTYDVETDVFTYTIRDLLPGECYTYRITAQGKGCYRNKSVKGVVSAAFAENRRTRLDD